MAVAEALRMIAALIAVIGMIGVAALLARKTGLAAPNGRLTKKRRLALVESLSLDARRRLAIVKCDDREHLIVLGPTGETLVQANLPSVADFEDPSDETQLAESNPFPSFAEIARRVKAGAKDAA